MKRKLGRPRGSKNKLKASKTDKNGPRRDFELSPYTQGYITGWIAGRANKGPLAGIDTTRKDW